MRETNREPLVKSVLDFKVSLKLRQSISFGILLKFERAMNPGVVGQKFKKNSLEIEEIYFSSSLRQERGNSAISYFESIISWTKNDREQSCSSKGFPFRSEHPFWNQRKKQRSRLLSSSRQNDESRYLNEIRQQRHTWRLFQRTTLSVIHHAGHFPTPSARTFHQSKMKIVTVKDHC